MRPLNYDGFGINDGDEYATRLCTFAKGVPESRRKELGSLFAAAQDLVDACHAFNDAYAFVSEHCPQPLTHAVRKARRALAKAKGIQS